MPGKHHCVAGETAASSKPLHTSGLHDSEDQKRLEQKIT